MDEKPAWMTDEEHAAGVLFLASVERRIVDLQAQEADLGAQLFEVRQRRAEIAARQRDLEAFIAVHQELSREQDDVPEAEAARQLPDEPEVLWRPKSDVPLTARQQQIVDALRASKGNQIEAAGALGIEVSGTIHALRKSGRMPEDVAALLDAVKAAKAARKDEPHVRMPRAIAQSLDDMAAEPDVTQSAEPETPDQRRLRHARERNQQTWAERNDKPAAK